MSDDRQAAKAEASAKHRVAVERLRRQWAVEGYDPRAHLRDVQQEGERGFFIDWWRIERDARPRVEHGAIGQWLAIADMAELVHLRR